MTLQRHSRASTPLAVVLLTPNAAALAILRLFDAEALDWPDITVVCESAALQTIDTSLPANEAAGFTIGQFAVLHAVLDPGGLVILALIDPRGRIVGYGKCWDERDGYNQEQSIECGHGAYSSTQWLHLAA